MWSAVDDPQETFTVSKFRQRVSELSISTRWEPNSHRLDWGMKQERLSSGFDGLGWVQKSALLHKRHNQLIQLLKKGLEYM